MSQIPQGPGLPPVPQIVTLPPIVINPSPALSAGQAVTSQLQSDLDVWAAAALQPFKDLAGLVASDYNQWLAGLLGAAQAVVKDIQAGLQDWILRYTQTVLNSVPQPAPPGSGAIVLPSVYQMVGPVPSAPSQVTTQQVAAYLLPYLGGFPLAPPPAGMGGQIHVSPAPVSAPIGAGQPSPLPAIGGQPPSSTGHVPGTQPTLPVASAGAIGLPPGSGPATLAPGPVVGQPTLPGGVVGVGAMAPPGGGPPPGAQPGQLPVAPAGVPPQAIPIALPPAGPAPQAAGLVGPLPPLPAAPPAAPPGGPSDQGAATTPVGPTLPPPPAPPAAPSIAPPAAPSIPGLPGVPIPGAGLFGGGRADQFPFAGQLPQPGTAQWCATVIQVRQGIADSAADLLTWLTDQGGPIDRAIDSLTSGLPGLPDQVGKGLAAVLKALPDTFWAPVRVTVQLWQTIGQKLAWSNPGELLALAALKTVIRSLHNLRLGTDALIWITVDLEAVLVPIEHTIDYLIQSSCPVMAVTPPEAVELFLADQISVDQLRCLIEMHGGVWENYLALTKARRTKLPPEALIEFGVRVGWNADQLRQALRGLGVLSEDEQSAWLALFNEIPPVTDLLRFAQRNVTVDDIVKRFQLDSEFDRFWQGALKQGLTSQGITEDWAQLYWRAHWVTASVEQGYDALRRLRPGRVPQGVEFTRADLENLYRENDVSTFWRERLARLAYQPVGIRYLRQLLQTGLITRQETAERLQDLGYAPDDASVLADAEVYLARRQAAQAGHGMTAAEAAKLYAEGQMPRQQVDGIFRFLGFEQEQADQLIERADQEWEAKIRQEKIAAIGRNYVHGAYTSVLVTTRLARLGILGTKIQQLLELWDVQRDGIVKHETAAKNVDWFKRGLITPAQLDDRLAQLGIEPEDRQLILAAAIQDLHHQQQKQAEASVKELLKQRQQLAKEAAQARLAGMRRTKHVATVAAQITAAELAAQEALYLAQLKASEEAELAKKPGPEKQAGIKGEAGIQEAEAKGKTRVAQAQTRARAELLPPP